MTAGDELKYEPGRLSPLLLRGADEARNDHPAYWLLSRATKPSLRAMPQRRNYRSEGPAVSGEEASMTMQTSDPKHSGFLHSVAGQITASVIVIAIIILLAWGYVF